MDKIFTIVKKELKRFFTDKRMLMTLFLPGILIYVIYALMGNFMNDAMKVSKDYVYNVMAVEVPSSMNDIFEDEKYKNTPGDIASKRILKAAGVKCRKVPHLDVQVTRG